MVTSPSMAKALLDEKSTTTSEPFLGRVMEKAFGAGKRMRKYNRAALYRVSTSFVTREPHVSTLSSSIIREIRQSVPNLVSFSLSMVDELPWERTSALLVNNESDPPTCDVNLFALIRNYVGSLTTTALMGRAFTESFPDFIPDLWEFSSRVDAMLVGITRFTPGPGLVPAYSARIRLIRSLTTFHTAFATAEAGNNPGIEWGDLDDISEFIQARSRALIDSGVPAGSAASENLFVLWAANIKIATLVYWNLYHILADDGLHAKILKEISPFAQASRPDMRASGFSIPEPPRLSLNLDGLLKSCPLFKSTFHETLRLHTSSFTYRKLKEKITLTESEEDAALAKRDHRPYQFHAGEYIAVPQYLLNSDPLHFEDPAEFDARRYFDAPAEEKDATPASDKDNVPLSTKQPNMPELEGILPFAPKDLECEGEEFAARAVMAFTAAVLAMWDIEPVDSGPWEIPKEKMGGLVLGPTSEIRAKMKLRV